MKCFAEIERLTRENQMLRTIIATSGEDSAVLAIRLRIGTTPQCARLLLALREAAGAPVSAPALGREIRSTSEGRALSAHLRVQVGALQRALRRAGWQVEIVRSAAGFSAERLPPEIFLAPPRAD